MDIEVKRLNANKLLVKVRRGGKLVRKVTTKPGQTVKF